MTISDDYWTRINYITFKISYYMACEIFISFIVFPKFYYSSDFYLIHTNIINVVVSLYVCLFCFHGSTA